MFSQSYSWSCRAELCLLASLAAGALSGCENGQGAMPTGPGAPSTEGAAGGVTIHTTESGVVVATYPDGTKEYGQLSACGGNQCISPRPCCTADGMCGYDVSHFAGKFDSSCIARRQPGPVDEACPAAPPVCDLSSCQEFVGCRLPSGECGINVLTLQDVVGTTVTQYDVGFGCVSVTLLDGWR